MTTIKVDKVIPKTGTSIALGDSGDTFTIPAGTTFENLGTATGFGTAGIVGVKTKQYLSSSSKTGTNWNEWTEFRLTYTAASTSNRLLFMAQIVHANTSATSTIFKFYNLLPFTIPSKKAALACIDISLSLLNSLSFIFT